MRAFETAAPGHAPDREAKSPQGDDHQKQPSETSNAAGNFADANPLDKIDKEGHAEDGGGD